MSFLQSAHQNKLIMDMRMGRLTRRVFLQRAQEVGLSSSIIMLLLNGCASSTPSTTPTTITWLSEGEVNGSHAFADLVKHFNIVNDNHINVVHQPIPGKDLYNSLISLFKGHQKQPEVVSLDVEWMSKFAAHRWVMPLDSYWPENQRTNYLQVPLKAATYENKLWGAPLHSDVGVLFYRTDLPNVIDLSSLKTWSDLEQSALAAQMQQKTQYGYIWQGHQYEGLVCNFVEIVSAYGGAIFDDVHNPQNVVVGTNSGALEALTTMARWVQTISRDVLDDNEVTNTNKWIAGEAAFMRNWPGAMSDSKNNAKSRVSETFQICALPSPAIPCLGGWQLAINSNAEKVKQDAAWQFISWMLQEDAQQYLAINEAFPATLATVYDDPYVQQANPFYAALKDFINNAQSRPVAPHYQCIANAIEYHVHRALTDQRYQPAIALQNLHTALVQVLAMPLTEDDCPALYQ